MPLALVLATGNHAARPAYTHMPGHQSEVLSLEYVPSIPGLSSLEIFLRKPCNIDNAYRILWLTYLYDRQVLYLKGEDIVIFRWTASYERRTKSWIASQYTVAFMVAYAKHCLEDGDVDEALAETPSPKDRAEETTKKAADARVGKGKGKAVAKQGSGGRRKKGGSTKRVSFADEEEEAEMSPAQEEPEDTDFDGDDDDDEDDDDDDDDCDDGMVEQLVEEEEVEELEGEETMSSVLRRTTNEAGYAPEDSSSSDSDGNDVSPPTPTHRSRNPVIAKTVSNAFATARSTSHNDPNNADAAVKQPVEAQQRLATQVGTDIFDRMFSAMEGPDGSSREAQEPVPSVPPMAAPCWVSNKQERKVPYLRSLCSFPPYQQLMDWHEQHPVCSNDLSSCNLYLSHFLLA